jgi:phage terminase Nu1 subunit (DNA packaging protein)
MDVLAFVSKRQLARDLGVDRETIDRWIARYEDFPIARRGGNDGTVWQFDLQAVRNFVAAKRREQDQEQAARRELIQAARAAVGRLA